jgi:putative nucleotidyltransferase with HDIG domain
MNRLTATYGTYFTATAGGTLPAWRFPLCPSPPTWRLDWPGLQQRFSWIGDMSSVVQEPIYHGEGDVMVHTQMVAEALTNLDGWREMDELGRTIVFAAALLHDVAKPRCTRVDADGRVSSPGHAVVGARLARYLLWEGEGCDAPAPFLYREAIARLVRFHGLPLWFLDKQDPRFAVLEASQTVPLDWVGVLAEADVHGRLYADSGEFLERIALFRDFCGENSCLTQPYRFPSDHSRFRYFGRAPGGSGYMADDLYASFDSTRFEVTLLSGLPGAGKDTWIGQHRAKLPVISLDSIRRELHVHPNERQGAVLHVARARARELLRKQQPFVWNATNVTRALRSGLIDLFYSYGARVHAVYCDAPRATIMRRNRARRESVPEHVIDRLARHLEVPDATEAHVVEWVSANCPD